MAKNHDDADGAIPVERFIAALTDFGPRRPELWPGLDAKFYELHELGDVGRRDRGNRHPRRRLGARALRLVRAGIVRLTLQDSSDFKPGTVTVYRVTARPDGGCHIDVDFHRAARTIRGRVVGVLVTLAGRRRFAAELRDALDRLARLPT